MFAKLKQKIAEEELTSDSSRSLPSSPNVRRGKVNGWTENKWERRRLSNASSLYESRESLLSESSVASSGYNISRRTSFTSRPCATPIGTPVEASNFTVNSRMPKEEILNLLSNKSDQVSKLEAKIADMASLLREQTRIKESLESALERQKEEHNSRIRSMNNDFERTLHEKDQEIENLDKAYLDQKGELAALQERLDDLARERTKYEVRDKQQQGRIATMDKEKKSLNDELTSTVNELTQKSSQLERCEKSRSQVEDELVNLRHSHALYKNKVTMEIEEKDGQIAQLKERVGDLQRRLEDSKLSGSDQVEAMEKEREQLESRLQESRDQLNELKSNTNDRINTLGSLVSTLNERLERKEAELSEFKTKYDQECENWKSKNLQLEQQLASLQKEANSGKRSSLEQRAQLEEQFVHLEEAREREKNEMKTKLDQLKMIENEYTRQEDYYKQQMADLEEEKEQLQNELMSKAEENRHVSLCLEDAMKETNELKSQFDSPSHFTASNLDSQTLENLKEELQISQIRCQNAEESLEHREKTIIELRKSVAEKEELLNCSTTKIRQYEENNRYLGNERIYPLEGRESHKEIKNLRGRVKELEEQAEEREMLQLDENELRDLRKDNNRLETDLEDKDKKIKLLQAKIIELKKAFQRELKMAAPGVEGSDKSSPSTPNGEVTTSNAERQEYLEVNFKYLKHVVLKYMCSNNKQSRQLINVIAYLLRFTPKEEKCVKEAMEWKLPLD
ncbi:golgin subfamily A member 1-like isoform X11 [Acropora millepora]|uniref:golgin subfamily A member 1-like isoform X11 n=1 Tax=Acropora millepora TaxID=45264 RepID=UPI001CF3E677|nr:golgin subfamily A member 1-like isoform X11 [Acropora millepora]